MKQIEKILAEIQRLKKDLDGYTAEEGLDYIESYINLISRESPTLPSNLGEAAEDQARSFGYQKEDYEYKELVETFIAGAKWQEKRDEETIKTAEDHAFLAGADWQKEQMMKEAVEGDVVAVGVGYDIAAIYYDRHHSSRVFLPHIDGRKYGDTVKLIVVKED